MPNLDPLPFPSDALEPHISARIGKGSFGGFLAATAFAMVAATGDSYFGLWYPVVIALMT